MTAHDNAELAHTTKSESGKMNKEIDQAIARIERAGYQVRAVGAGSDGVRKWAVHRRDPMSGYSPRSYFTAESLMALSLLEGKREVADMIAAARINCNKFLLIKGDKEMSKNRTTANTEKTARESRKQSTAKSNGKAAATKTIAKSNGKATKAPAARATKKSAKAATAKSSGYVVGTDPVLDLLHSKQDQTIERMVANNIVKLFKRINAATMDKPVTHASLNAYDKRQARELARLELVAKENVPDVGLAYFRIK